MANSDHFATRATLGTKVLLTCLGVAAATLLCQSASLATNACQQPNPNLVFCTSIIRTYSCADEDRAFCNGTVSAAERNQFPDGAVQAGSGTTKEAESDCYRTKMCVWDDDTSVCQPAADYGMWFQEDKTVVGTNKCPTTEE